MRSVALILPILLLCSCSDGPAIRKHLAECELAAQKQGDLVFGMYDPGYLQICMQSDGYVWDGNLAAEDEGRCRDVALTFQKASCYRDDSWTAEAWAKEVHSN